MIHRKQNRHKKYMEVKQWPTNQRHHSTEDVGERKASEPNVRAGSLSHKPLQQGKESSDSWTAITPSDRFGRSNAFWQKRSLVKFKQYEPYQQPYGVAQTDRDKADFACNSIYTADQAQQCSVPSLADACMSPAGESSERPSSDLVATQFKVRPVYDQQQTAEDIRQPSPVKDWRPIIGSSKIVSTTLIKLQGEESPAKTQRALSPKKVQDSDSPIVYDTVMRLTSPYPSQGKYGSSPEPIRLPGADSLTDIVGENLARLQGIPVKRIKQHKNTQDMIELLESTEGDELTKYLQDNHPKILEKPRKLSKEYIRDFINSSQVSEGMAMSTQHEIKPVYSGTQVTDLNTLQTQGLGPRDASPKSQLAVDVKEAMAALTRGYERIVQQQSQMAKEISPRTQLAGDVKEAMGALTRGYERMVQQRFPATEYSDRYISAPSDQRGQSPNRSAQLTLPDAHGTFSDVNTVMSSFKPNMSNVDDRVDANDELGNYDEQQDDINVDRRSPLGFGNVDFQKHLNEMIATHSQRMSPESVLTDAEYFTMAPRKMFQNGQRGVIRDLPSPASSTKSREAFRVMQRMTQPRRDSMEQADYPQAGSRFPFSKSGNLQSLELPHGMSRGKSRDRENNPQKVLTEVQEALRLIRDIQSSTSQVSSDIPVKEVTSKAQQALDQVHKAQETQNQCLGIGPSNTGEQRGNTVSQVVQEQKEKALTETQQALQLIIGALSGGFTQYGANKGFTPEDLSQRALSQAQQALQSLQDAQQAEIQQTYRESGTIDGVQGMFPRSLATSPQLSNMQPHMMSYSYQQADSAPVPEGQQLRPRKSSMRAVVDDFRPSRRLEGPSPTGMSSAKEAFQVTGSGKQNKPDMTRRSPYRDEKPAQSTPNRTGTLKDFKDVQNGSELQSDGYTNFDRLRQRDGMNVVGEYIQQPKSPNWTLAQLESPGQIQGRSKSPQSSSPKMKSPNQEVYMAYQRNPHIFEEQPRKQDPVQEASRTSEQLISQAKSPNEFLARSASREHSAFKPVKGALTEEPSFPKSMAQDQDWHLKQSEKHGSVGEEKNKISSEAQNAYRIIQNIAKAQSQRKGRKISDQENISEKHDGKPEKFTEQPATYLVSGLTGKPGSQFRSVVDQGQEHSQKQLSEAQKALHVIHGAQKGDVELLERGRFVAQGNKNLDQTDDVPEDQRLHDQTRHQKLLKEAKKDQQIIHDAQKAEERHSGRNGEARTMDVSDRDSSRHPHKPLSEAQKALHVIHGAQKAGVELHERARFGSRGNKNLDQTNDLPEDQRLHDQTRHQKLLIEAKKDQQIIHDAQKAEERHSGRNGEPRTMDVSDRDSSRHPHKPLSEAQKALQAIHNAQATGEQVVDDKGFHGRVHDVEMFRKTKIHGYKKTGTEVLESKPVKNADEKFIHAIKRQQKVQQETHDAIAEALKQAPDQWANQGSHKVVSGKDHIRESSRKGQAGAVSPLSSPLGSEDIQPFQFQQRERVSQNSEMEDNKFKPVSSTRKSREVVDQKFPGLKSPLGFQRGKEEPSGSEEENRSKFVPFHNTPVEFPRQRFDKENSVPLENNQGGFTPAFLSQQTRHLDAAPIVVDGLSEGKSARTQRIQNDIDEKHPKTNPSSLKSRNQKEQSDLGDHHEKKKSNHRFDVPTRNEHSFEFANEKSEFVPSYKVHAPSTEQSREASRDLAAHNISAIKSPLQFHRVSFDKENLASRGQDVRHFNSTVQSQQKRHHEFYGAAAVDDVLTEGKVRTPLISNTLDQMNSKTNPSSFKARNQMEKLDISDGHKKKKSDHVSEEASTGHDHLIGQERVLLVPLPSSKKYGKNVIASNHRIEIHEEHSQHAQLNELVWSTTGEKLKVVDLVKQPSSQISFVGNDYEGRRGQYLHEKYASKHEAKWPVRPLERQEESVTVYEKISNSSAVESRPYSPFEDIRRGTSPFEGQTGTNINVGQEKEHLDIDVKSRGNHPAVRQNEEHLFLQSFQQGSALRGQNIESYEGESRGNFPFGNNRFTFGDSTKKSLRRESRDHSPIEKRNESSGKPGSPKDWKLIAKDDTREFIPRNQASPSKSREKVVQPSSLITEPVTKSDKPEQQSEKQSIHILQYSPSRAILKKIHENRSTPASSARGSIAGSKEDQPKPLVTTQQLTNGSDKSRTPEKLVENSYQPSDSKKLRGVNDFQSKQQQITQHHRHKSVQHTLSKVESWKQQRQENQLLLDFSNRKVGEIPTPVAGRKEVASDETPSLSSREKKTKSDQKSEASSDDSKMSSHKRDYDVRGVKQQKSVNKPSSKTNKSKTTISLVESIYKQKAKGKVSSGHSKQPLPIRRPPDGGLTKSPSLQIDHSFIGKRSFKSELNVEKLRHNFPKPGERKRSRSVSPFVIFNQSGATQMSENLPTTGSKNLKDIMEAANGGQSPMTQQEPDSYAAGSFNKSYNSPMLQRYLERSDDSFESQPPDSVPYLESQGVSMNRSAIDSLASSVPDDNSKSDQSVSEEMRLMSIDGQLHDQYGVPIVPVPVGNFYKEVVAEVKDLNKEHPMASARESMKRQQKQAGSSQGSGGAEARNVRLGDLTSTTTTGSARKQNDFGFKNYFQSRAKQQPSIPSLKESKHSTIKRESEHGSKGNASGSSASQSKKGSLADGWLELDSDKSINSSRLGNDIDEKKERQASITSTKSTTSRGRTSKTSIGSSQGKKKSEITKTYSAQQSGQATRNSNKSIQETKFAKGGLAVIESASKCLSMVGDLAQFKGAKSATNVPRRSIDQDHQPHKFEYEIPGGKLAPETVEGFKKRVQLPQVSPVDTASKNASVSSSKDEDGRGAKMESSKEEPDDNVEEISTVVDSVAKGFDAAVVDLSSETEQNLSVSDLLNKIKLPFKSLFSPRKRKLEKLCCIEKDPNSLLSDWTQTSPSVYTSGRDAFTTCKLLPCQGLSYTKISSDRGIIAEPVPSTSHGLQPKRPWSKRLQISRIPKPTGKAVEKSKSPVHVEKLKPIAPPVDQTESTLQKQKPKIQYISPREKRQLINKKKKEAACLESQPRKKLVPSSEADSSHQGSSRSSTLSSRGKTTIPFKAIRFAQPCSLRRNVKFPVQTPPKTVSCQTEAASSAKKSAQKLQIPADISSQFRSIVSEAQNVIQSTLQNELRNALSQGHCSVRSKSPTFPPSLGTDRSSPDHTAKAMRSTDQDAQLLAQQCVKSTVPRPGSPCPFNPNLTCPAQSVEPEKPLVSCPHRRSPSPPGEVETRHATWSDRPMSPHTRQGLGETRQTSFFSSPHPTPPGVEKSGEATSSNRPRPAPMQQETKNPLWSNRPISPNNQRGMVDSKPVSLFESTPSNMPKPAPTRQEVETRNAMWNNKPIPSPALQGKGQNKAATMRDRPLLTSRGEETRLAVGSNRPEPLSHNRQRSPSVEFCHTAHVKFNIFQSQDQAYHDTFGQGRVSPPLTATQSFGSGRPNSPCPFSPHLQCPGQGLITEQSWQWSVPSVQSPYSYDSRLQQNFDPDGSIAASWPPTGSTYSIEPVYGSFPPTFGADHVDQSFNPDMYSTPYVYQDTQSPQYQEEDHLSQSTEISRYALSPPLITQIQGRKSPLVNYTVQRPCRSQSPDNRTAAIPTDTQQVYQTTGQEAKRSAFGKRLTQHPGLQNQPRVPSPVQEQDENDSIYVENYEGKAVYSPDGCLLNIAKACRDKSRYLKTHRLGPFQLLKESHPEMADSEKGITDEPDLTFKTVTDLEDGPHEDDELSHIRLATLTDIPKHTLEEDIPDRNTTSEVIQKFYHEYDTHKCEEDPATKKKRHSSLPIQRKDIMGDFFTGMREHRISDEEDMIRQPRHPRNISINPTATLHSMLNLINENENARNDSDMLVQVSEGRFESSQTNGLFSKSQNMSQNYRYNSASAMQVEGADDSGAIYRNFMAARISDQSDLFMQGRNAKPRVRKYEEELEGFTNPRFRLDSSGVPIENNVSLMADRSTIFEQSDPFADRRTIKSHRQTDDVLEGYPNPRFRLESYGVPTENTASSRASEQSDPFLHESSNQHQRQNNDVLEKYTNPRFEAYEIPAGKSFPSEVSEQSDLFLRERTIHQQRQNDGVSEGCPNPRFRLESYDNPTGNTAPSRVSEQSHPFPHERSIQHQRQSDNDVLNGCPNPRFRFESYEISTGNILPSKASEQSNPFPQERSSQPQRDDVLDGCPNPRFRLESYDIATGNNVPPTLSMQSDSFQQGRTFEPLRQRDNLSERASNLDAHPNEASEQPPSNVHFNVSDHESESSKQSIFIRIKSPNPTPHKESENVTPSQAAPAVSASVKESKPTNKRTQPLHGSPTYSLSKPTQQAERLPKHDPAPKQPQRLPQQKPVQKVAKRRLVNQKGNTLQSSPTVTFCTKDKDITVQRTGRTIRRSVSPVGDSKDAPSSQRRPVSQPSPIKHQQKPVSSGAPSPKQPLSPQKDGRHEQNTSQGSNPNDSLASFEQHEKSVVTSTSEKPKAFDIVKFPEKQENRVSLQEALLKKNPRFLQSAEQRRRKLKDPNHKQEIHERVKAKTSSGHLTRTINSWVKMRTGQTIKGKGPRARLNEEVQTSADRKEKAVTNYERSHRLYNNLEEVKKKKQDEQRKKAQAVNRQRRKEFEMRLAAKRKRPREGT